MHQNIDVVDRKPNNMSGGSLILKCKDFRLIKLDIAQTEDLNNVATTLESIISVSEYRLLSIISTMNIFNTIDFSL